MNILSRLVSLVSVGSSVLWASSCWHDPYEHEHVDVDVAADSGARADTHSDVRSETPEQPSTSGAAIEVSYSTSVPGSDYIYWFIPTNSQTMYKLADNAVTISATPTPGHAIEALAIVVDGRTTVHEIVQPAVDEPVIWTCDLDTFSMGEGIQPIAYQLWEDGGRFLELSEEIRVLLNVVAMAPRDDHMIWLGTMEHGLALYDLGDDLSSIADDQSVVHVLQATEDDVAQSVTALLTDGESGLWVGTFGWGLFYIGDNNTPFDLSDDQQIRLPLEVWFVTSIVQDPGSNGLWIGTMEGLYYYKHNGTPLDTSDDGWRAYPSDGHYDPQISRLNVDDQGNLWIASFDLTSDESDRNALVVLGPPANRYEDSRAHWGRFPELTSVMPNTTYTLAIDSIGLKWIGTTQGLFVLDDNGTPFDPEDDLFAQRTRTHGLPDNDVAAITPRDDGSLWVGTFDVCGGAGGGLTLFDLSSNAVDFCNGDPESKLRCNALIPHPAQQALTYTTADGLLDSDVSSIVELADGSVLIGTFNMLAAPVVEDLIGWLTDSDTFDEQCEADVQPITNPDLHPTEFVRSPGDGDGTNPGRDGLSVIQTGADLFDKIDDTITNL